ncbi:MAG TPA: phosphoribosyltransferase family protein [Gammaproteobacteria bacterium]|nr:phosphoribosyltransferase family protein [Gammaproteobacteria bacterium]
MFRDRLDAAEQLARRLSHLKGQHPLVVGIPRGAVPMAKLIADALDGELDVVLVHKLGAPGNPEYAIGAISEDGTLQISEAADRLFAGGDYLQEEAQAQLSVLQARRLRYTPGRKPIDVTGRIVVVVDDGSATGATLLAALRVLREQRPQRLIAAIGVAPADTLSKIEAAADEVVCLAAPSFFYAVGQFFDDFRQVSDEEVIELLGHSESADKPH